MVNIKHIVVAPQLITPQWPAPDNIVALSSCRSGGVSTQAYSSLNLADHVGDSERHVAENRKILQQHCKGLERIQWLNQVHGTDVFSIDCSIDCSIDIVTMDNILMDGTLVESLPATEPAADSCTTQHVGLACAVMAADCLPVLFCDATGEQIAAAHAGWRGLVAGVLENTVQHFSCDPHQIMVWLGPAIGPQQFEVGSEVRQVFLDAATAGQQLMITEAFEPSINNGGYYFADLYQLARIRLQHMGIDSIYGGDFCTYRDQQQFFSYRRDGITGRMVTLIYKS
ncbi:MAG: peptidoglycan editing factor PgeF [Pseudomonadales bacterium]